MVKFVKCIVMVSRLRIEKFDSTTGLPVIIAKNDWNGEPYKETQEVTYKRGEEIILPINIMEKLGKSVSVVMAPVTYEPAEVTHVPAKGGLKEANEGPTVADMIPKEEPVNKTPIRTKAK
jgi:hypothetical protein